MIALRSSFDARQAGAPRETRPRGTSLAHPAAMKLIGTRLHGALDYLTGALLIAAPALLGDTLAPPPAQRVLRTLGVLAILYSALTRYEFGLMKLIPFRGHLALDWLHALTLGFSPLVFGCTQAWPPYVVLGLLEILIITNTRDSRPYADHRPAGLEPGP
jgi:hypothetical protein